MRKLFFHLLLVLVGILSVPSWSRALDQGEAKDCAPACLDCHPRVTQGDQKHPALKSACVVCHSVEHDKNTNRFPPGAQKKGLVAEGPALCYRCHDPLLFKWAYVHPGLEKSCTGCHNPHSSDVGKVLIKSEPDLCRTCHDRKTCSGYTDSAGHAKAKIVCSTCHNPHASPVKKLLKAEDPRVCVDCHGKSGMFEGKSFHSAIGLGCSFCHSPHSTQEKGVIKTQMPGLCYKCHKPFARKTIHPPIELCTNCHKPHASPNDKLLVEEQTKLCVSCHKAKNFKARYVHGPVALGLCTSCHLPHDSDNPKLLKASGAALCYICHYAEDFARKNVHPPLAKGECLKCHDPHAASGRFQIDGPINDLCLKCHEKQGKEPHVLRGFAGKEHPMRGIPDPKRPGRRFSCSGCHNPHSSDSVKLFRYPAQRSTDVCNNCHEK